MTIIHIKRKEADMSLKGKVALITGGNSAVGLPQLPPFGSQGLPASSGYAATKAAIRSFARTWTTDIKGRHIRVNAISPGPIDTERLRKLFGSSPTGQERLKSINSTVPLGRLGKPEEIAKAAVFLASQDSSFIPGVELFVDRGFAQVEGMPGRAIGVRSYLIARPVSIV